MTGLIAKCTDSGCPQKEKCLRFMINSASDWQVYAWFRGVEDSCEYYLPIQQNELPSQG